MPLEIVNHCKNVLQKKKNPYLWSHKHFCRKSKIKELKNKEFYYFHLMHPQYRAMSISHTIYLILQMDFFCLRICRAYIFMCFAFFCLYLFLCPGEEQNDDDDDDMNFFFWGHYIVLAVYFSTHSSTTFVLTSYKIFWCLFVVPHFFGYLFEACCISGGWRHCWMDEWDFFN